MIRQANPYDAMSIALLAINMWQEHSVEDLTSEFVALLSADNTAVFIAESATEIIGFAQCQLRYDYVEGTQTSPVGYLEGIYILPANRGQQFAAKLLSACEDWSREKGCTEFASDCELSNLESLSFHLHTGFREANRIICFTKKL